MKDRNQTLINIRTTPIVRAIDIAQYILAEYGRNIMLIDQIQLQDTVLTMIETGEILITDSYEQAATKVLERMS